MKFRSLSVLLITFLMLSCNGQTNKSVENITPEAFAKKINETPAKTKNLNIIFICFSG